MEKEQEVMVETAEAAAPVENTAKRKSNASVPVDQFDWDSFEEDSSEADRRADEEKYNQTLSKVVEARGARKHRVQERGCHQYL